jgi:hypothetical protein
MAESGEIRIEPISAEHIEGFHKALDTVARERDICRCSKPFRWKKHAFSCLA